MDPTLLHSLGTSLDVFGRVFGAVGSLENGTATEMAARYRAEQLRINAGQAMASAQREAITAEQQSKRVASRALALAAASGGGATDPTVVNLISGIAAEGAYRQAVALYQGQEQARAMENQARATEYEGEKAKAAGIKNAIGGFIGAGAASANGIARGQSLLAKYGGNGPVTKDVGPGTASWGMDLGID
jgi:hypothetical protein